MFLTKRVQISLYWIGWLKPSWFMWLDWTKSARIIGIT